MNHLLPPRSASFPWIAFGLCFAIVRAVCAAEPFPRSAPEAEGFDPVRFDRIRIALVFCQHLPFDQHGLFTRFRTAVSQALR